MAFLQNLWVYSVILPLVLTRGSREHPCVPQTDYPWIYWIMSPRVRSACPFSLALFRTVNLMGWSSIQKCCLQNPKRPTKQCASFLMSGGVRCTKLSFTLKSMGQQDWDHWSPRNFTEVVDSWILMRFISHFSGMCPIKATRRLATFCSPGPSSTKS